VGRWHINAKQPAELRVAMDKIKFSEILKMFSSNLVIRSGFGKAADPVPFLRAIL